MSWGRKINELSEAPISANAANNPRRVPGGRHVGNERAQAVGLQRGVAPRRQFRHDARVPRPARRRAGPRDPEGEDGRQVQHPEALPAADAEAVGRLLQVVRHRHRPGDDVEQHVPLRAQQHQDDAAPAQRHSRGVQHGDDDGKEHRSREGGEHLDDRL